MDFNTGISVNKSPYSLHSTALKHDKVWMECLVFISYDSSGEVSSYLLEHLMVKCIEQ